MLLALTSLTQAQQGCSINILNGLPEYNYNLISFSEENYYYSLSQFVSGYNLSFAFETPIEGLSIYPALSTVGQAQQTVPATSKVLGTSFYQAPQGAVTYALLEMVSVGAMNLRFFTSVINSGIPNFNYSVQSLLVTNSTKCFGVTMLTENVAVADCVTNIPDFGIVQTWSYLANINQLSATAKSIPLMGATNLYTFHVRNSVTYPNQGYIYYMQYVPFNQYTAGDIEEDYIDVYLFYETPS